jgi:glyoxylase-like metal-dependent hydrolase (beta-lactamase superfamily II)
MKVFRDSDNLYRLTQLGLVNCFLVLETDGFTLVDTGFPGSGKEIIRVAEKLGKPIRTIVLTHGHFDHVGAGDEILARSPDVDFCVGARESRILSGDLSLLPSKSGKRLFGFSKVSATPTKLLMPGDKVGALSVVGSPGHTPGHISLFDSRDDSLIAGDAYVTQTGVIAAGVFRVLFPFPAVFSWNGTLAAESAAALQALKPSLLAVGHGASVKSPVGTMDRAVKEAFRQHPDAVRH